MIALVARVKRAGEQFLGDQRELSLLNGDPDEGQPYERLLSDALRGEDALFSREDTVEAAWAIVDPVLEHPGPTHRYQPGTWGPTQADALIEAPGTWHNPTSGVASATGESDRLHK